MYAASAAGVALAGGLAMSGVADASPAPTPAPVSTKPEATQVEPEVLAGLRAAEQKAASGGTVDEKAEAIAENLGNPDTTPSGKLTGQVTDTRGRPMAGATIVLMDTDGNLLAENLTDAAGKYKVTSLQNGPYVVQVTPPTSLASSWARTWYPSDPSFLRANVVSVTDRGAIANVTVQPGASLRLAATTLGKAEAGAQIQVCAESYLDCQVAKSDANGSVLFQGLPVAPLRVAVTTSKGSRYEFATTITAPGAIQLTLDTSDGNLVIRGKS